MFYVFECMFAMIFGDAGYVLSTTGEALCWKDIGVGLLAYFTIVSLIVGIANLAAFLLHNKDASRRYEGLKYLNRKTLLITAIVFLVLCLVSIIVNVFICCFA